MKDQAKTKEQLIDEVTSLKKKIAEFERLKRKRNAAANLLLRIDREVSDYFENGTRVSAWKWIVPSGQVKLRFDAGSPEPRHDWVGTWEELVRSDHLDMLMVKLESFSQRPLVGGPKFFWFSTQGGETFLAAYYWQQIDHDEDDQLTLGGGLYDWPPIIDIVQEFIEIFEEDLPGDQPDPQSFFIEASWELFVWANAETVRSRSRDLWQQRASKQWEMRTDLITVLKWATTTRSLGAFFQDSSMKYTYVDPRIASHLGLPQSEIIGRADSELFDGQCKVVTKEVRKNFKQPALRKVIKMTSGETWTELVTIAVAVTSWHGKIINYCGVAFAPREHESDHGEIDYEAPAMRRLREKARKVAKTDTTVLLTGETGSGKDYTAEYIHNHSGRARGPYRMINCAAVPAEVAESELFGHEKGGYTGAHQRKRGLLELAEGGSLLLNEIGELSLPLQGKLLTFLDTKKFTRVGGEKDITVNVRIIAATNRDLGKEVEEGRFRKDLFYRINVMQIRVPSVNEYPEDAPKVIQSLLRTLQEQMQLPFQPYLDPVDEKKMVAHSWPGGLREIRNVLERSMILSEGPRLPIDLPAPGSKGGEEPANAASEGAWTWKVTFPPQRKPVELYKDMKRALIDQALRHSGGNQSKAAPLLHISRDALVKQMKNLKMRVAKRHTSREDVSDSHSAS